jgi:hypothetical protein
MIRGSASLMGAPLWNRTEAGLGIGALTLLSYPSVPLSSSPFDGMKCRDDRRRATLVMSGGCILSPRKMMSYDFYILAFIYHCRPVAEGRRPGDSNRTSTGGRCGRRT